MSDRKRPPYTRVTLYLSDDEAALIDREASTMGLKRPAVIKMFTFPVLKERQRQREQNNAVGHPVSV